MYSIIFKTASDFICDLKIHQTNRLLGRFIDNNTIFENDQIILVAFDYFLPIFFNKNNTRNIIRCSSRPPQQVFARFTLQSLKPYCPVCYKHTHLFSEKCENTTTKKKKKRERIRPEERILEV